MKDHLVKKQWLPPHEVNANPAIDRRGNRSHIAISTGAVERPEALRYLPPIHWLSNRNGQSRGRFRKYPPVFRHNPHRNDGFGRIVGVLRRRGAHLPRWRFLLRLRVPRRNSHKECGGDNLAQPVPTIRFHASTGAEEAKHSGVARPPRLGAITNS